MLGWLRKLTAGGYHGNIEKRATASGFTHEVIQMREAFISGRRGIGELTATAQAAVSLWEGGLSMSDVTGTDLLDRRSMALLGRSLALRGEGLFKITDDGLIPCSDWDLRTRNGRPVAYRVGLSEAAGGTSETLLAGEVLHVRIGSDPSTPWLGTAPLRRAQLTASLLQAVESALAEAYENMPLASMIIPFPESPETDLETLGRGFRAKRGRVLLRESVNVSAAGGAAPPTDWKPQDVTPDLQRAMTRETLQAAREAIAMAFGVLPGLLNAATTGPMVREAQRHLATWTLQPIAALVAEEASEKLSTEIGIDVLRPLQAFDAGGRARALSTIVEAMATAKQADLDPAAVAGALRLVDWQD